MFFEGLLRARGHVGACLRRGLESRYVPFLDDGRESFKLILGKVGGARGSAKEVDIGGAYKLQHLPLLMDICWLFSNVEMAGG